MVSTVHGLDHCTNYSIEIGAGPYIYRQRNQNYSMESFDDTSSVGSTGSYSGSTNSTGSITYPVRSSMKKPRKAGSTASGDSAGGQSKKSVSYAIGSEQTAV